MAVIQNFPNLRVAIGSQGVCSQEYVDDGQGKLRKNLKGACVPSDTKELTSTCYIESVTNAPFDVVLGVRGNWDYTCTSLGFEIIVDGTHVETTICHPNDFVKGSWQQVVSGQVTPCTDTKTRASGLRRFKFSGIAFDPLLSSKKSVDYHQKARLEADAQSLNNVGSICVKIHRMKPGKECPITFFKPQLWSVSPISSISEKSLKESTLSHSVTFEKQEHINISRHLYNAVFIDGLDNPMAIFRFQYRSKETLTSLSTANTPTFQHVTPKITCDTPSEYSTNNPDPLAGISSDRVRALAQERVSRMTIYDLTLKEAEGLAMTHFPLTNFSSVTLKKLKEYATFGLELKQATVNSLPEEELQRLAMETLKSRGDVADQATVQPIAPTTTYNNALPPIVRNIGGSQSANQSASLKFFSPRQSSSCQGTLTPELQQPTKKVVERGVINEPIIGGLATMIAKSSQLAKTSKAVPTIAISQSEQPIALKPTFKLRISRQEPLTMLESVIINSLQLLQELFPHGIPISVLLEYVIKNRQNPKSTMEKPRESLIIIVLSGLIDAKTIDKLILGGSKSVFEEFHRSTRRDCATELGVKRAEELFHAHLSARSKHHTSISSVLTATSGNSISKRKLDNDASTDKTSEVGNSGQPHKIVKRSGARMIDLTNDSDDD